MADGEIKTTEVSDDSIVDEGESGRMEWPYIPFKAWFKLVPDKFTTGRPTWLNPLVWKITRGLKPRTPNKVAGKRQQLPHGHVAMHIV